MTPPKVRSNLAQSVDQFHAQTDYLPSLDDKLHGLRRIASLTECKLGIRQQKFSIYKPCCWFYKSSSNIIEANSRFFLFACQFSERRKNSEVVNDTISHKIEWLKSTNLLNNDFQNAQKSHSDS